jgi:tetratricopeptide (TPR) repeat protein
MQYATSRPAISQIARDLNAGSIMECSVRYAGDDIRVTAQLIDPNTDEQLWSEAYPGNIGDVRAIFAMQADIAMNIANALNAEFSIAEQTRIEQAPTTSAEAYALFLEARDLLNNNPANLPEVLERLDRTLELDPQFAEALGYRASQAAYRLINSIVVTVADPVEREAMRREIEADVERALAINDSVSYAWLARGVVGTLAFRWQSADEAFARALALTPNGPDVLREYAPLKALRGEKQEALRLIDRAVEIAPSDFTIQVYRANVALWAADTEMLLESLDNLVELNPNFAPARMNRGLALNQVNRRVEAESNLRAGEDLIASAGLRSFLPPLAYGYQRLGLTDDARRVRDEYVSAVDADAIGAGDRLLLSLAIDDVEMAYELVVRARERAERGEIDPGFFATVTLRGNPHADPRLDEPRFRAAFDRIFEVAMSR